MGRTPHPLEPQHQPRAARLALRNTAKPMLSSDTQMNTQSTGFAVITSQTSPTTVLMELILPRMVATVVVLDSCVSPPLLKDQWLRGMDLNHRLRAQNPACCHYNTPPCNTLRSCCKSGSAAQRVGYVLHFLFSQLQQLLHVTELVLHRPDQTDRRIIPGRELRQFFLLLVDTIL